MRALKFKIAKNAHRFGSFYVLHDIKLLERPLRWLTFQESFLGVMAGVSIMWSTKLFHKSIKLPLSHENPTNRKIIANTRCTNFYPSETTTQCFHPCHDISYHSFKFLDALVLFTTRCPKELSWELQWITAYLVFRDTYVLRYSAVNNYWSVEQFI